MKYNHFAVTKKDVIFGADRDLSVCVLQIFLEKVTTWALGYDTVHEIGRRRESEMKRLGEKRILWNPIVDQGALGNA